MFNLQQLRNSRNYYPQVDQEHKNRGSSSSSTNLNHQILITNVPPNYDYRASRLQLPPELYIPRTSENMRELNSLMFKAHYGLLANCPPPINFQSHFSQPKYTFPPCYCNHPPAPTTYKSHPLVYNSIPCYKPCGTDCNQSAKKDEDPFLTERELDLILERALEGYDANNPANSQVNVSIGNGHQNYQCPSTNLQGDNATLAVAMAPNASLKMNTSEGKDRKKPRKQPNPRKSADFEDPNFQGVVISMHARLEGTDSKLTIYSSFRYDYFID